MSDIFTWWAVQEALTDPRYHSLWRDLVGAWLPIGRGNVVPDVSGQGNPMAVTNAAIPASWVGGADGWMLDLDGTDAEVVASRVAGLSNWSAWLSYIPDDVTGISRTLLDQGDIFIGQIGDDIIYGATDTLEITYSSTVSSCLTAGQPVDIVVTRSGTTITAYVFDANGALTTDSFTATGTANSSRTNLVIGAPSRTALAYVDFTPTDLAAAGEKALLITSGDDIRFPVGSASLNDPLKTENWNNTQMTIKLDIESLAFVPGDGLTHYLLNNVGTGSGENSLHFRIASTTSLQFYVYDTTPTTHLLAASVAGWTIGDPHQIVGTIDMNSDEMALYIDGVLVDDAGHNLSSDTITAIGAATQFGATSSQASQFNGSAAIQIYNTVQDATWVAAQWNSGDGVAFVVDPDTILMARFSEESTGIVYWHTGQKISNISTVTLTTANDVGSRWANGEAVLVFDDDDPANAVYTTISGTPSGTTITVADSCAAVSGTNKCISKNLLIDPGMESAGVANITAGANQTVTKDGTVVFKDSLSLKDVFAAANDNDESTIWSPTLVNSQVYLLKTWANISSIYPTSSLLIDIDGSATPITSYDITDLKIPAFASLNGSSHEFSRSDTDFPESSITGDMTIQGWVRFDTVAAGTSTLLAKYGYSGNRSYRVLRNADEVGMMVSTNGTDVITKYTAGMNMVADTWYHIAAVYDAAAGTVDFYKDGAFVEQETGFPNSIFNSTAGLDVGANLGGSFFAGDIFNICLFDDKRTAGEILASATTPAEDLSGAGNIIGQWMFDDEPGETVIDNTQGDAGRDLELGGGTTTNYGTHTRDEESQVIYIIFTADQAAITGKLRITGAGAGTNTATAYLDDSVLRPVVAGDSLSDAIQYTLIYNVDTAATGALWSGLGSEATEVKAGDLYIVNDTADASTATRARDFADGRVLPAVLWKRKLTALEVAELSRTRQGMFAYDDSAIIPSQ